MSVHKFCAPTPREALRQVRDALGADALILANRRTPAGVEIVAVAPNELESMTGTPSLPAAPADLAPVEAPSYDLVHEVRLLRALVEGELAAFAWNDLKRRDASKVEVLRRLVAAGFSAGLARRLTDDLPDGLDLARAWREAKTRLQSQLPVSAARSSLVEQGGMFALVGPTGVGKTTTVAKLAAECALKFGPDSLALVSTDTYRIGAIDQLRIYGDILGAPVYAIHDDQELQRTLTELRGRHLVLIDTVGMGQRDRRIVEQIALLVGAGEELRSVLLLSAVSQASVLDDVVRSYGAENLSGCILTKVDEAVCLGGALDVLIRLRLDVHYLTNGQRVPEDLHRPNPLYLVERAFRALADLPSPDDSEMPVVLAAGAPSV
jgi:flagellar biosynthesis protein FlhF